MKKTPIHAALVLLPAVLALFGTVPAGGTEAETTIDLREITVRSSRFSSGAVTLKNGEFHGSSVPGSVAETFVKLTDKQAFGKVNGRDAAAVVLVTDPGGSGKFYDLALLFKGKGGWVNIDTVPLGDRVKVHLVDIKDSEIFVGMSTHGPGDALCCPKQEVTRSFALQADRLVAKEEGKNNDRGQEIVGPVWRWVQTRFNDDVTLNPPANAAGYTIQMNREGTIQVKGDCNVSGGSFKENGNELIIAITHSTMAACPEGSLEDKFLHDLNRAGRFRLKNSILYLDLQFDSGTMEFRHKQ